LPGAGTVHHINNRLLLDRGVPETEGAAIARGLSAPSRLHWRLVDT
jgi:hypothetical protein